MSLVGESMNALRVNAKEARPAARVFQAAASCSKGQDECTKCLLKKKKRPNSKMAQSAMAIPTISLLLCTHFFTVFLPHIFLLSSLRGLISFL